MMSTATLTETITTAKPARARRSHLPGQKPFGALRISALVVLIILAIGWLLPFLWAVATAFKTCLLYTSPSPRDVEESRMPSSA